MKLCCLLVSTNNLTDTYTSLWNCLNLTAWLSCEPETRDQCFVQMHEDEWREKGHGLLLRNAAKTPQMKWHTGNDLLSTSRQGHWYWFVFNPTVAIISVPSVLRLWRSLSILSLKILHCDTANGRLHNVTIGLCLLRICGDYVRKMSP